MVAVRLKAGTKAGEVIEVADDVAQAFVVSGKAELVEPETAEAAEVVETPEKPKTGRRRKVVEKETR